MFLYIENLFVEKSLDVVGGVSYNLFHHFLYYQRPPFVLLGVVAAYGFTLDIQNLAQGLLGAAIFAI